MKTSKSAPLDAVVRFADRLLGHAEAGDYAGAKNGLQVANDGTVTKVAAAVDANILTMRDAADLGADMLVVHHGLFWGGAQPLVGLQREKWRIALTADIAVYSSHLPLDAHSVIGNNVLLAKAMGFARSKPFLPSHGQNIGRKVTAMGHGMSLVAVASRLGRAVGGSPVRVIAGGSSFVGEIGIVTGGAGDLLAQAVAEGVDTFITGEAQHSAFGLAHELGVNLLLAGHYATETFGVKALAARISARFGVPWSFIDRPSGL